MILTLFGILHEDSISVVSNDLNHCLFCGNNTGTVKIIKFNIDTDDAVLMQTISDEKYKEYRTTKELEGRE